MPAARSRSASAAQLDRFRQEGRFDVAFRLEENRWNGTVAPQLVVKRVFDGEPRYRELREWLAGLWREGAEAWPPEAAAIFAELELGETKSGAAISLNRRLSAPCSRRRRRSPRPPDQRR